MGYDVYGEIYYGIPVGGRPWDEENDRGGWYDPETEEDFFATEDNGSIHLIPLGSYENDNFLLGIEVKESYWGNPMEITPELFDTFPHWDAEIREKCKILGVEYSQPKFYLSAYFSY